MPVTTLLVENRSATDHTTPMGHPEQVARIEAITTALAASPFGALTRVDAPLAQHSDLLLCHPQHHIDRIENAIPAGDAIPLDPDTYVSAGSWEAALRGVGGNLLAVDQVMAGAARNAFVATRPPGHHCETAKPMGFCLFGNVALAARHAMERHHLQRVAVVDFDVHHGNGTQDLLWDEPRALFMSSQQMPLYPGTGSPSERGGSNNVVNVALDPGSDGAVMRRAYEAQVFPRLEAYKPELILISAGFDAHADDPLANLNWREEDFTWLTRRICEIANIHCEGRVVSTLEGGYDLSALAASVAAHVIELMEHA